MKTMSVRDLQRNIRECMNVAQKERVVITRHGLPAAIVIGVEGHDWEDVLYRASPGFWGMIEERRREKPVSLAELRRRVGVPNKRRRSKR